MALVSPVPRVGIQRFSASTLGGIEMSVRMGGRSVEGEVLEISGGGATWLAPRGTPEAERLAADPLGARFSVVLRGLRGLRVGRTIALDLVVLYAQRTAKGVVVSGALEDGGFTGAALERELGRLVERRQSTRVPIESSTARMVLCDAERRRIGAGSLRSLSVDAASFLLPSYLQPMLQDGRPVTAVLRLTEIDEEVAGGGVILSTRTLSVQAMTVVVRFDEALSEGMARPLRSWERAVSARL